MTTFCCATASKEPSLLKATQRAAQSLWRKEYRHVQAKPAPPALPPPAEAEAEAEEEEEEEKEEEEEEEDTASCTEERGGTCARHSRTEPSVAQVAQEDEPPPPPGVGAKATHVTRAPPWGRSTCAASR